MNGILIENGERPDIALSSGVLYGGLHCGDCFRCLIDGQWETVRLEKSEDWFLVLNEKNIPVPYGAQVQI